MRTRGKVPVGSSRAVEAALSTRSNMVDPFKVERKKEGKWDSGECACDPIGHTDLEYVLLYFHCHFHIALRDMSVKPYFRNNHSLYVKKKLGLSSRGGRKYQ